MKDHFSLILLTWDTSRQDEGPFFTSFPLQVSSTLVEVVQTQCLSCLSLCFCCGGGGGGGSCLTTCMLFNFKYKMYVYSRLLSIFKFVLNMLGDGPLSGFFFDFFLLSSLLPVPFYHFMMMIAFIMHCSPLLSILTALTCDSTWVTSFL